MKKLKPTSNGRKLMDRLAPEISHGRLLGTFATTYEMQPEFFETDFLPTMLGLGAWDDRTWSSRIALEKHLAELEAATMFLDAHPYPGRPRSLHVEVVPVSLKSGRILHAKILICVLDEAVRLFVGSANLTEPGYRRNREVVAELAATAARPGDAHLISHAIREMDRILDESMTIGSRQLLAVALERLDKWKVAESDSDRWFVWGGAERPLCKQFIDCWPQGDQVERITIVSPFWSEERNNGPITKFVEMLKERGSIKPGAELRLLTEAAPDRQTTFKPVLPESFGDFDAGAIGVNANALAVDPRVPPEDVGMGDEFTGSRALHAKIVLLEGQNSSLLFTGSANFSRHGWGFLSDPVLANIEAGLIVRRTGAERGVFQSLIPATIGDPVPLKGAATGRLALPNPSPEEPPWPAFLREVVLQPSESDPDQLDLVLIVTDEVVGSWLISHLPKEDLPRHILLSVEQAEPNRTTHRVSLSKDSLAQLLREQEVHVVWWQCSDGRSFPINVAASARISLPISPGTGRPEEQHLIAYYQGRITWEDLFPDPDNGGPPPPPGSADESTNNCGVDTSKIQAYIVREFVEALKGINDDLKAAAKASKTCMRLALLGSVSPVALAKRIVEAVDSRERTPTASAFQLVEILGCLDAAKYFDTSSHFRDDWTALVDEASTKTAAMLATLEQRFPDELSREFKRYARAIRQHHLQSRGKK